MENKNLWIYIYLLIGLSINTLSEQWSRLEGLSGFLISRDPIWSFPSSSATHCVIECILDITCDVAQFNKDTKYCQGFDDGSLTVTSTVVNSNVYQQCGTCLSDYPLQFGTSCYKYNGSAITDTYGAQIACRETGGYLVRLGSDGETEFIRTLVNTLLNVNNDNHVHIDGSDSVTEGTYLYYNNQPVTYFKWNGTAPGGPAYEDCLHLKPNYDFYMNDGPCSKSGLYVCERDGC